MGLFPFWLWLPSCLQAQDLWVTLMCEAQPLGRGCYVGSTLIQSMIFESTWSFILDSGEWGMRWWPNQSLLSSYSKSRFSWQIVHWVFHFQATLAIPWPVIAGTGRLFREKHRSRSSWGIAELADVCGRNMSRFGIWRRISWALREKMGDQWETNGRCGILVNVGSNEDHIAISRRWLHDSPMRPLPPWCWTRRGHQLILNGNGWRVWLWRNGETLCSYHRIWVLIKTTHCGVSLFFQKWFAAFTQLHFCSSVRLSDMSCYQIHRKVPNHPVAQRCRALVRESLGDLEGARRGQNAVKPQASKIGWFSNMRTPGW